MKLRRGVVVAVGAVALLAMSGVPARAASTTTVDSTVYETSSGGGTVTFTTVGQQWTLGSTVLTFLTDVCGEQHCEFTGTFSADDGHADGLTGTFSSSIVVDDTTGQNVDTITVAFTVTGGFGVYAGATGSGNLDAQAVCTFGLVCAGPVGSQHFEFTVGAASEPPPTTGGGSGHQHTDGCPAHNVQSQGQGGGPRQPDQSRGAQHESDCGAGVRS